MSEKDQEIDGNGTSVGSSHADVGSVLPEKAQTSRRSGEGTQSGSSQEPFDHYTSKDQRI